VEIPGFWIGILQSPQVHVNKPLDIPLMVPIHPAQRRHAQLVARLDMVRDQEHGLVFGS
jgi:hypothetical protein